MSAAASPLFVPRRSLAALLVFGALMAVAGSAAAEGQTSTERVELNTASLEELCTLPGIGPKKAEAIINAREKRRFTRVTQLLRVRGIGMKTLERLRAFVYIAPPRLAPAAPKRGRPAKAPPPS